MVLQRHLQCQIIYITPATKYKHHSTAILIYIVTSGWCSTAWFLNWKTLFLMCNMIIHYRTYLQNGITNTFAMPNNFYITSNQIQTPFNYYFDTHSDKCMMYYSMVFNWMTLLLMCKMIFYYRTYLQNGITNTLTMPNNFYINSKQIQTPFNYHFDINSDKLMMYYSMVFLLNDTVPDVQDDHPLQNISSEWYYKHICNAK